jgi:hypothetical protein
MHGLANGLILSLSVMEDTEPAYLTAPSKWLKDSTAQIVRTPRSVDFAPGTAELYEDGAMWSGPPATQEQHSPQSDQWSNSIPSTLGRGLTQEQLFQRLKRLKNVSRDELQQLQQRYDGHAIIAPIITALLSDTEIKSLVGASHNVDCFR